MPNKPPIRGSDALRAAFIVRPKLPPEAAFEVDPAELEIISD
jgi:hypothetical protein